MSIAPSRPATTTDADWARAALRAMPWTLLSLAAVVGGNALAGTLQAKPSAALLRQQGLGLDTLRAGKVWTLVTSIYLLDHPKAVLSTLAVIGLYLGAYELLAGTLAASGGWFLGTWVTVTLAPLVWLPCAWAGWASPVMATATAEFGSSASTWCLLGGLLGWPRAWRGWRRWAALAGCALLAGRLAVFRTFTDVEHISAFASGVLLLGWLAPPTTRPPRAQLAGWQVARLVAALAGLLVAVTGVLAATLEQRYALCALTLAAGAALALGALRLPRRGWPVVLALLAAAGALAIAQIPNIATMAVVAAAGLLLVGTRGAPHAVPSRDHLKAAKEAHGGAIE